MSTCPECYEDTGCTCVKNKKIKELEEENRELKNQLGMATRYLMALIEQAGDKLDEIPITKEYDDAIMEGAGMRNDQIEREE